MSRSGQAVQLPRPFEKELFSNETKKREITIPE